MCFMIQGLIVFDIPKLCSSYSHVPQFLQGRGGQNSGFLNVDGLFDMNRMFSSSRDQPLSFAQNN